MPKLPEALEEAGVVLDGLTNDRVGAVAGPFLLHSF